MIREETVFGPIHSRRLGSSLGINLLPEKGKICNFDCIYCECGWNKDGRDDTKLPSAEKVRHALEAKLQQCKADQIPIDSITFSGDGEPTINPEFPQIIDDTIRLRNLYYPNSKITVLSNATRVHKPEVFKALRKVDNPTMKIDAPTNELIEKIDHPAPGYDIARVVEALKQFHGDFILQTMFLRGERDGRRFDCTDRRHSDAWVRMVLRLRPREVMMYTLDRVPPLNTLQKVSVEEMQEIARPLVDAGILVQIKG